MRRFQTLCTVIPNDQTETYETVLRLAQTYQSSATALLLRVGLLRADLVVREPPTNEQAATTSSSADQLAIAMEETQ